MQGQHDQDGMWVAGGGAGERLAVLLHGLGATASVWWGLARVLETRGWRWLAPDLRGHGRSPADGPHGYGNHAADLSRLLRDQDPARVTVLGHSFGGVVGAVLAGGLFGPVPARLVTLGVKIDWSDADIAGAMAVAARPARVFASRDEAQERYLKVAGLAGLVSPDAPSAEGGVRAVDGGFALAMAPGVYTAVGPSIPGLLRAARSPLTMAAGQLDPMVSPDSMHAIDPAARVLPGLGHNAHVEDPGRVADLLDSA